MEKRKVKKPFIVQYSSKEILYLQLPYVGVNTWCSLLITLLPQKYSCTGTALLGEGLYRHGTAESKTVPARLMLNQVVWWKPVIVTTLILSWEDVKRQREEKLWNWNFLDLVKKYLLQGYICVFSVNYLNVSIF